MQTVLSAILIAVGAFFMFVAALGIVRMPDLFLRMSATSKAATLGAASILLATAVYFNDLGIASRALATIVFLLLTTPIAAHILGRAAYLTGTPLWEGTVCDELRGRYDVRTRTLASSPHPLQQTDHQETVQH
ncbi:MAG: monovalent cation/H(+) antiporter subunit G [Candidatus Binatia bacterium]|nr:monovalent cation/H(+) antiporter subunit G [Candidatus Binatia bacterium]